MARTNTALRARGWWMREAGALEPCELTLDEPGRGTCIVRVAGCGLCHTDVSFVHEGVEPRAPLPLVLGHEISGEVVAAGRGAERWLGRAVIVPAVTPCGDCESCRSGHGTICPHQCMPGNDAHGGFATHVAVPARGLCPIDDPAALRGAKIADSGATLAELAVVADAVSTPYQAARRARIEPGDLVLVVGLGGVGGFAAQIARAFGATVIGFDPCETRRRMLSAHGVALALDPRGQDGRALREECRRFARERELPATRWKILECSGTAAGQELAWSLLGPGAHLSVVGYTRDRVSLRLSSLMAFDAQAVGNWGCLPELYPAALDLVLSGAVQVAPFVELFPLDEIEDVLHAAREHRLVRRPVLVPRREARS